MAYGVSERNNLRNLVIDNPDKKEFKVNAQMYSDPQIFEWEMEQIFEKTWVYIGHESQIQYENDYITAYIGREPVILSRGKNGQINCMINRCTHRGATVCRAQRGNSNHFRCFYHGWTYQNNGKLIGVADRAGYPAEFDIETHGLVHVPRVGSYQGFVFASLSADGPSLEEHLGNAKPYLDLVVHKYPDGIEVAKGISKYGYAGNWKMQNENTLDYYHPLFVHKSYFDVVARRGVKREGASLQFKERVSDNQIYLGGGHGVTVHYRNFLKASYSADEMFPDNFDTAEWEEKVGPLLAKWSRKFSMHLLIYPNLLIVESPGLQIRTVRPVEVNQTEVLGYAYFPKGQPDIYTARQLRAYEDFFGPAGNGTPDDMAAFDACTVGYQSRIAPWNDLSRGYDREVQELEISELSGFETAGNISDDTVYRGMYRHWVEVMER